MNQNKNKIYLEHIRDSIGRIKQHLRSVEKNKFLKDQKTMDAVICQLMILGEAAGNIDTEFQEKYPEIPWRKIIGMRNQLIHGYSEIDVETVWKTCHYDIPNLEKEIKIILS